LQKLAYVSLAYPCGNRKCLFMSDAILEEELPHDLPHDLLHELLSIEIEINKNLLEPQNATTLMPQSKQNLKNR